MTTTPSVDPTPTPVTITIPTDDARELHALAHSATIPTHVFAKPGGRALVSVSAAVDQLAAGAATVSFVLPARDALAIASADRALGSMPAGTASGRMYNAVARRVDELSDELAADRFTRRRIVELGDVEGTR